MATLATIPNDYDDPPGLVRRCITKSMLLIVTRSPFPNKAEYDLTGGEQSPFRIFNAFAMRAENCLDLPREGTLREQ